MFLQSNLTHLHRSEYVPGVGNGIAKCPYDPNDNSTAVWVEHGNPGELPALYSGTNAEFTKADAIIFRTDLHNLTTGRKEFSYKRTLKYDSKWLDSKYKQVPETNNTLYQKGLADLVFVSRRKTDPFLAHVVCWYRVAQLQPSKHSRDSIKAAIFAATCPCSGAII